MRVKVKRSYFKKVQKISILNELSLSGVNLSELARKYQISPVVFYKWKKKITELVWMTRQADEDRLRLDREDQRSGELSLV